MVRTILERGGYRVEEAEDGEEALALAEETRPDLVLLDVGLPGIDGPEVCRRLRAEQVISPILMLTGFGSEEDKVAGLASESHAIPAVHETAEDRPCPTRTAKRPANVVTPASAIVAMESSATPKIVSRRAPIRGLQCPTTGEPNRTAPEYAPTAMPACVFERCRSRA